jgi:dTMP kinase
MPKIKNKLFVIEGGDGSGKATQIALLNEKLKSHGHSVSIFDFPQYEGSTFGKLCGEALKGDHGDFRNMSPYLASLPYSLDRFSAKEKILEAAKKGIVLFNRYTSSNTAFQAAKLSGKAREKFISFLEGTEYDFLGLPRPTRVIYLYVPIQTATELVGKKDVRNHLGKKQGIKDQHERDLDFQKVVAKTYISFTKSRPDWIMINCAPKGKLLSKEDVHLLVLEEVNKVLKK